MAKITRNRLARGTKLTPDHIAKTVEDAGNSLENKIVSGQMAVGHAPWRVNVFIPNLTSAILEDYPNIVFPYFETPVVFPPFQEDMDVSKGGASPGKYTLSADTKFPIVDEISFGFDTRDEPAAIVDQFHSINTVTAAGDEDGFLDYDRLDVYDNIGVSLVSKEQFYFLPTADYPTQPYGAAIPDRVHANLPLSSAAMASRNFRANPFVVTDLNITINPYRTYFLRVNVLGLAKAFADVRGVSDTGGHALVSLMISMVGTYPLSQRDTGATIQNIPSDHDGSQAFTIFSPDQPEVGDVIQADGAEGISEHIAQIDAEYHEGLKGGYPPFLGGDTIPRGHITDDAAYDVIYVPLMVNAYRGQDNQTWEDANNPRADRRHISLQYPMTIHHVFLMFNWAQPQIQSSSSSRPSNIGWTCDVELLMGRGVRSEAYSYETIARLTITEPDNAATWETNLVDRCIEETVDTGIVLYERVVEWEVHNVPLVGSGGAGYYTQGKPVWVGRTWSGQSTRRVIDGTASACQGEETFLEARMIIDRDGSLSFQGGDGHWLAIYGKKHLMAADRRGMKRG